MPGEDTATLVPCYTEDLLRRGDHRSVQALEKDIRTWVAAWNQNPKPFVWTKTAGQILASLGRLLSPDPPARFG